MDDAGRFMKNDGAIVGGSFIVTIDGPAGSGKTTVSRLVAEGLGFDYVDTGALYRGVAYAAVNTKIRLDDDDALDRLTPEEVAAIIAELEDYSLEVTREAAAPGEVLVAEGDSWFDYGPAGLDIIDCLKKFYSYRIHNVAKAGDTLDNMAWGSEYDHNWSPKPPPLDETLDAVRRYRPRVVLLSGSGNDFAGNELLSLLNHKKSGLPAIRQEYADFVFNTYSCRAYEEIINNIWEIDDTISYHHPWVWLRATGWAGSDPYLGILFPWAVVAAGLDRQGVYQKTGAGTDHLRFGRSVQRDARKAQ